ncbi:MAG: hypothetical protein F6K47_02725 [Symploca sp. SIO2E6]|nr:hypothetical protein [Symploca sp. SIO2E6]
MKPQLQQAIDLAQSLSFIEQLELLKAVSNIVQRADVQQVDLLKMQNQDFWKTRSIKDLVEEQQPPKITDLSLLSIDFWVREEPIDEFLSFLHQQRQPEQLKSL